MHVLPSWVTANSDMRWKQHPLDRKYGSLSAIAKNSVFYSLDMMSCVAVSSLFLPYHFYQVKALVKASHLSSLHARQVLYHAPGFIHGFLLSLIARDISLVTKCYLNIPKFNELKDKDVALIIEAADTSKNLSYKWKVIKNLQQAGYAPYVIRISSIKEVKNVINNLKEQDYKIKLLWIRAHGDDLSIRIGENGEDNVFSPLNDHDFLPIISSLEPKSIVVLQSCSTGSTKLTQNPIAKKIAKAAPKECVVYAPTEDVNSMSLQVKNLQPFEVGFQNNLGLSSFWRVGQDITKVYHQSNADE